MKNRNIWKPSKYIYKNGNLVSSADPEEVGIASRLITNLVAKEYEFALPQYASGKLLGLGCGKVPLFEAYRDLITDNICVDWSATMHKTSHIDLEHDLTKPLPFQDSEFDTVIFSDVLEHLPDPESSFNEISRVLASNGHLIMNVPFYYWIHEEPNDYYRYTEFALSRFADNSGLRVVQLKTIGGAPEVLADIFAKNLIRVPRIGGLIASLAQRTTLLLLPSNKSSKRFNRFPLGYFMVAKKLRNEPLTNSADPKG